MPSEFLLDKKCAHGHGERKKKGNGVFKQQKNNITLYIISVKLP